MHRLSRHSAGHAQDQKHFSLDMGAWLATKQKIYNEYMHGDGAAKLHLRKPLSAVRTARCQMRTYGARVQAQSMSLPVYQGVAGRWNHHLEEGRVGRRVSQWCQSNDASVSHRTDECDRASQPQASHTKLQSPITRHTARTVLQLFLAVGPDPH